MYDFTKVFLLVIKNPRSDPFKWSTYKCSIVWRRYQLKCRPNTSHDTPIYEFKVKQIDQVVRLQTSQVPSYEFASQQSREWMQLKTRWGQKQFLRWISWVLNSVLVAPSKIFLVCEEQEVNLDPLSKGQWSRSRQAKYSWDFLQHRFHQITVTKLSNDFLLERANG